MTASSVFKRCCAPKTNIIVNVNYNFKKIIKQKRFEPQGAAQERRGRQDLGDIVRSEMN